VDAWAIAAFVVTTVLFDITPGPAVVKVTGDAVANGWAKAQYSIAGILAANGVYCSLAAFGLSAIFIAAPLLFEFVKWVGVAYLCWLGIGAIRSALTASPLSIETRSAASGLQLFRSSFVLQGANPKTILYFGAVLPAFAATSENVTVTIFVLGAASVLIEYPILSLYSFLGSRVRHMFSTDRARRVFSAVSGVAVIGAAMLVGRTSLQER
jgi:threonine/homoserine/homoserine lactone efflux protein